MDNEQNGPAGSPLQPTATSTAALFAASENNGAGPQGAVEQAPDRDGDTEGEILPRLDPEPPIETPTPTQAEIDDVKRGVRLPDPPIAPAKKVRNMKLGRDGASTTRDI